MSSRAKTWSHRYLFPLAPPTSEQVDQRWPVGSAVDPATTSAAIAAIMTSAYVAGRSGWRSLPSERQDRMMSSRSERLTPSLAFEPMFDPALMELDSTFFDDDAEPAPSPRELEPYFQ